MGKGRADYKVYVESFVGKTIARLTILEIVPVLRGKSIVRAVCSCGVIKNYKISSLISGNTKSCGCFEMELHTKHGLHDHPLYSVWVGIKERCYNPNYKKYSIYGGAGVTMCAEWLSNFISFYNWAIANGWKKGLRIDKDKKAKEGQLKIYSPETCSIVTTKENNRNLKTNRLIEYQGKTLCMGEWAEILNIPYYTFSNRVRRGWTIDRVINTPFKKSA